MVNVISITNEECKILSNQPIGDTYLCTVSIPGKGLCTVCTTLCDKAPIK